MSCLPENALAFSNIEGQRPQKTTVGTTIVSVLGNDTNRIVALVAVLFPLLSTIGNQVEVGVMDGAEFCPLITLTLGSASAMLKRADCGSWLTQELFARASAASHTVTATSIRLKPGRN